MASESGTTNIERLSPNSWTNPKTGIIFFQRIFSSYSTAVHKSTKVTPFLAMFRECARLSFEVSGECSPDEISSEQVDIMAHVNTTVGDMVSHNISRAQEKQIKQYDDRHAFHSKIKPGDKVLIINSARQHRIKDTMTPMCLGPYEV